MSTALIWIIMIAVMAASYIIQNSLQRRFDKYAKIPTSTGLSGAEIARKMLQENGIYDVKVESVPGKLTDHYNPQTKTVNLSAAVYDQRSIAAAAVAAHECGHVIQHAKGYAPLRLRTAMVPIVNFSSMAVQWVLLAGLLLVNVFPTQIETAILSVESVLPVYQIILTRDHGLDNIEVDIEVNETIFHDRVSAIEDIRHTISHAIERILGIRVFVKMCAPNSIPRSEGKAKRVIDTAAARKASDGPRPTVRECGPSSPRGKGRNAPSPHTGCRIPAGTPIHCRSSR